MTAVSMSILAIILISAAIVLLVAEVFLPSFGILGIGSGLCAIAAVVLVSWVNPTLGVICAIVLLVISPFAIYRIIKVYPTTAVGKRVLLEQPVSAEPVFNQQSSLLGKQGRAITILRPAGVAEIDGKRVDCVSEGDIIEPGKSVIVVSLSNGRVIVRAGEKALV